MFFEFPPHCGQESLWLHCPNNNLNLRVKSEPVTARAELFCTSIHCILYTVYCILYSILYLSSTEIRHTALAVLLQIGFLATVLQQQGPFDCSSSAEIVLWLLFFSRKALWLLFINRKGPLAAVLEQQDPFDCSSSAKRSFLTTHLQKKGLFGCSSSTERVLWLLFFSRKALWLLFFSRKSSLAALLQQ